MKILVKDVNKRYIQGEKEIMALQNINLDIRENCFSVIVGPSGCGKSTLLRILAALDYPTSGDVYYDETNICQISDVRRSALRRQKIGMVYQDFGLLPTFTAMENICTPALMDGKKPDMAYIMKICQILGIEHRLHHLPHEMSGGEQQRTAVARALVNKPAIVLADEPTGNLDKTSAQELIALLMQMKQEFHQTLLMVTHDMTIADQADVKICMDNGMLCHS
ncbi:MAG: ABC transporter ATP-binding protein [Clostridia bacterium]|nr:ABC transporter ATP-binding protein [Clostridia bacterium]